MSQLEKPIKRIGIVGAGLMGSTIAVQIASHGLEVMLFDTSPEQLARAEKKLDGSNLKIVHALEAMKSADFILEAIFEDLSIKRKLLTTLSEIVPPPCIIASNTSSLLISDLSPSVAKPQRFLGVHYNNPADFNPIVEIISAPETDNWVLENVNNFVSLTEKTPIVCGDTHGFVLNRQSLPYLNEAVRCLQLADAATIDHVATTELGMGLGPIAVVNLVGLGVMSAASKNLSILGEGYAASELLLEKAVGNDTSFEIGEAQSDGVDVATIKDRLLAAMLFPAHDILEKQLTSKENLHQICVQALGYSTSSVHRLDSIEEAELKRLINLHLGD